MTRRRYNRPASAPAGCDMAALAARRLVCAVVVQAAKDARRGDVEARVWLADCGAALLCDLGMAVDVGGWLAALDK